MRVRDENRRAASPSEDRSWKTSIGRFSRSCDSCGPELATARKVPAYVIFSDATLRELARWKPIDVAALDQIQGFGRKKALEYGTGILKLIRDYVERNRIKIRGGWASAGPPSARQMPQTHAGKRGSGRTAGEPP